MSTVGTIASGVLVGLKVFSEERRRHFQKKYHDLLNDVTQAENAHAPDYNDAALALAKQALQNFEKAYAEELNNEIDKLLSKVVDNA